jgi:N6-L-threonylcarbamoyladenine synthase
MKVLAIETSCDETGVAIVEGEKINPPAGGGFEFRVLGSALASQASMQAQYGGVFPNVAKREHEKNLPIMLEQALKSAGGSIQSLGIDAIAVTEGPGLEPALWQGITFAQKLAKEENLPLLPINHMEGHLLSSLAQKQSNNLQNVGVSELKEVQLPVLALLISGGHTEFVLMREWFRYEILGQTLDDAVGECFDKVARMLGLPYPGGPMISQHADFARKNNLTSKIVLPRPMLRSNSCDVSFSGLKTAALYALKDVELSEDEKKAFAREFEDAVGDVFTTKTRRALQESGAKTFVIGGGVAANRYLRDLLQQLITDEFDDVDFRLPELSITGDNAIMIAEAALIRRLSNLNDERSELRAFSNRFSILTPK